MCFLPSRSSFFSFPGKKKALEVKHFIIFRHLFLPRSLVLCPIISLYVLCSRMRCYNSAYFPRFLHEKENRGEVTHTRIFPRKKEFLSPKKNTPSLQEGLSAKMFYLVAWLEGEGRGKREEKEKEWTEAKVISHEKNLQIKKIPVIFQAKKRTSTSLGTSEQGRNIFEKEKSFSGKTLRPKKTFLPPPWGECIYDWNIFFCILVFSFCFKHNRSRDKYEEAPPTLFFIFFFL